MIRSSDEASGEAYLSFWARVLAKVVLDGLKLLTDFGDNLG